MEAMRSRRSRRSRIMSIAPWSSRNSLRWKPSGRVSRTVCWITRRSGEPDEGLGLRDVDVAEHREARGDAARGRVRLHRDERQALGRERRERRARLRHLQERQQPLLHAGAAARRKAHERLPVRDGVLDAAHEALAHHGAHRAAHEGELECARDDLDGFERAAHDDDRIALADGLLRRGESVAITLAVTEPQWVLGRDVGADLDRTVGIQELGQALACADAHVVCALRADLQVALDLRPVEHRIAGRALHPQAFGHGPGAPFGLDPRRDDLLEPGHVTPPQGP